VLETAPGLYMRNCRNILPVLVIYPFFGFLLSPIIAAAAMSFSWVSVVSNALRLRGVNSDTELTPKKPWPSNPPLLCYEEVKMIQYSGFAYF
jgi:hypothetical protein